MAEAPKIESADLSIEDVYKDFYAVPDFQREYVWDSSNVEVLLRDIYDEFYDEQKRQLPSTEYFIGSIVVYRDKAGVFQLIDGQQRMTTIYIVLCALRDYFTAKDQKAPDSLDGMIYSAMLDDVGNDVSKYRLELQYADSDGALEKIADKEVQIKDIKERTKSVSKMLEAYRTTFSDFLQVEFGDDVPAVKKFFAAFVKRVKLIRIVTPNASHALKVFETINDRGVGLNAMDLLKNLLFMKASQEQYAKLKAEWERLVRILDGCGEKPLRFLRYFIMSRYKMESSKPINEDEIYQWLSERSAKLGIDTKPLEFLGDLIENAKAYAGFVEMENPSGKPNRYLKNIARLSGKARQHFILLLAARKLDDELLLKLADHIERLFFTYVITREPTKAFEYRFATWAQELGNCDTESKLDSFIAEYLAKDMAGRAKQFDFAFAGLTESEIQKYRLKYVLAKLTQYIDEKAWNSPALTDIDHYINGQNEIEHVLPQTKSAPWSDGFQTDEDYNDYCSRLGNLTLLEKTINGSIQHKPYDLKLDGYSQSAFLITRAIKELPKVGTNTALNRAVSLLQSYKVWGKESIEARQSTIAALARKVWGFDAVET